MLYRGVIVPGERVAHDKVWGFGVSFSGSTNASWSLWYGSCCIHLVIGSPASNVSVVCIFQNSVGASTRHVFIMGFRHRVMRKVGLKIMAFFFVYRTLAYGTLRRSSCLFRLPAVRAKSKWESWTGQNPIFWSGSCVVRIWWSPLDRGIWNLWSPLDRVIWNLWLGMLTGPWPISCKIVSCLLHKPFFMSSANDWFCIFWGLSYRAAQQRYIV